MTRGATRGPGVPGGWVRRAGRLDTGGGETVLWSVAEGRRGRRWRSLRLAADGRPIADLLLEVDPAGRWTRLELATSRGILTLHPEPDATAAHGNVVTARGVVPLSLGWSPGHHLRVAGEPVAAAALGVPGPEMPEAGPGILVAADLSVVAADDVLPMVRPAGDLPGPSWPLEAEEAGP